MHSCSHIFGGLLVAVTPLLPACATGESQSAPSPERPIQPNPAPLISPAGSRSAGGSPKPAPAEPDDRAALTKVLHVLEAALTGGEAASGHPPTVVVLPPLSPRFETTRRSRIISEAIITQLAASGRLRIMDRDRLELLLEEHRLEYGGLFDESTLPAIGKLLGADSFIMGRYFDVQDGIQLYLRVVAADTGLIRSSQAVHLREDPVPPVDASNDMVAIGARLAGELAVQMKLVLGRPSSVAVLSFPTIEGEPTMLESDLADAIEIGLAQIPGFTVVSRSSLQKILAEHQLQTSGRFSDAALASVGKFSGATFVVTGVMFKSAQRLAIHVRLLDTATGKAVAACGLALLADNATLARFEAHRLERAFQNFPEVLVRPAGTIFFMSGAEYPEWSMVPALAPFKTASFDNQKQGALQVVPTDQGPGFLETTENRYEFHKPFSSSLPLLVEFAVAGGDKWREQWFNPVIQVDDDGKHNDAKHLHAISSYCRPDGGRVICQLCLHSNAEHPCTDVSAAALGEPLWLQIFVGEKQVRFNLVCRSEEEPDIHTGVLPLTVPMERGPHQFAVGFRAARPLLFVRAIGGVK